MNMLALGCFARTDRKHLAHGWAVSTVIHGLGVSLVLVLVTDLTLPAQPETFRWEVAMVEAPAPTVIEEPKPLEPPPSMPKQIARIPIERTPAVQSVQPVQQMVRQEVTQQRPMTQVMTQSVETKMRADEAVHETGQPLMRPTPEVSATPAPLANAEPTTRAQAESLPVSHRQAAVGQSPTVRPTAAVVSDSREQPSATPGPLVQAEPTTRVQAAALPVAHHQEALDQQASVVRAAAVVKESPEQPTPPTVVHRPAIREMPLRSYPESKADFGWLSEALWHRIEQLKRYPTLAKTHHWEGKVVLEAVIRDDGTILGLQVAESSGHSVLDQDAMMVMRQASPLILKHPLGRLRVTILVPITYKLDG